MYVPMWVFKIVIEGSVNLMAHFWGVNPRLITSCLYCSSGWI
jgi:hypothetical protein